MGEVVRAYDHLRGHEVALKYLTRADDPSWLLMFKQEYRLVADLVHPNVVSLYELQAMSDGRWAIAMELIEGARSFLEHVRPHQHLRSKETNLSTESRLETAATYSTAPAKRDAAAPSLDDATMTTFPSGADVLEGLRSASQPVDAALQQATVVPERLVESVSQAVRGLEAVHRRGLFHRDVKPSNVLVDGSGRVVVCDFGLVTTVGMSEEHFRGTLPYASPEQLRGEAVTSASDYYSLGVMIYQALTGRLPVWPEDRTGWLKAKEQQRVAPLGVEHPLGSLALRLLSPDPSSRPDVGEIRKELEPLEVGLARAPSIPGPEPDAPFVGRAKELRLLWTAFDDARKLGPVQVDVSAASGTGKSALVSAFVESARTKTGAVVLHGRCYESESVPFKSLDPLVDALYGHLLSKERSGHRYEARKGLAALSQLFPVLRQLTFVLEASRTETVAKHQVISQARAALYELLNEVAREAPLIVVVDDLQWGDADSVPFFRTWVETPNPEAPGFLVVTTQRTDVPNTGTMDGTRPLLEEDSGRAGFERKRTIYLEPLTHAEAVELAGQVVPMSSEDLDGLVRQSGGYPMFVVELARAATGLGLGKLAGGEVPNLDTLIGLRAQQLSRDAQRLLQGVALVAEPQPLSLLARAMQVKSEASALAELRAARMIRVLSHRDGERISTYHDRVRGSVVSTLEPERKRRLHRRIARAFQRASRPDAESLMAHWAGAGDYERATPHALKAAEVAWGVGAFNRAAELYGKVLGWQTLEPEKHRQVSRSWAEAQKASGHPKPAAETFLKLAEGASAEEARHLRVEALVCLLRAGDMRKALGLIESRVITQSGIPESKWSATWGIVCDQIALVRRVPWKKEISLRPADDDRPNPEMERMPNLCAAVAYLDNLRGYAMHMRMLRKAMTTGEPHLVAWATAVAAIYNGTLQGESARKESESWLATAKSALAVLPNGTADQSIRKMAYEGFVAAAEGLMMFAGGDRFLHAGDLMEKGGRAQRQAPEFSVNGIHMQAIALTALGLGGRVRSVDDRFRSLLNRAEEEGNDEVKHVLLLQAGPVFFFARDEVQRGRQLLESIAPDRAIFTLPVWWHENALGALEEYAGHVDAAAARHEQVIADYRRSSLSKARGTLYYSIEGLARASIRLSARGGSQAKTHRKRVLRCVREVRKLQPVLPPLAEGLAAYCTAALAALDGDRDRATDSLREAVVAWSRAEYFMSATPAKLHLGRLLGGTEGSDMLREVDEWAHTEGIVDLDRFVTARAPFPA